MKINRLLQQVRAFQPDCIPSDSVVKPKRYKYPSTYDPYAQKPAPSERIVQLAERIASLSPKERLQIGPTLRYKLRHPYKRLAYPDAIDSSSPQGDAAVMTGEKEKTTFDIKLEKFDAAAKIKVIKEVRAFVGLGLKEAKELVEKAPVLLKQGVTKEDAGQFVDKISAAGGVASME